MTYDELMLELVSVREYERNHCQGMDCENSHCPGWDVFTTNRGRKEVERCDTCTRFDNDEQALWHAVWALWVRDERTCVCGEKCEDPSWHSCHECGRVFQ